MPIRPQLSNLKFYARAVIAIAAFALALPGMIAAWDSISHAVTGGCADNRTGQVFRPDGMVEAGGYCVMQNAAAGYYTAYDEVEYHVRSDGVVEPSVYFRWQGAQGIPDGVARLAQIGMMGAIALAAASLAYMLIPITTVGDEDG